MHTQRSKAMGLCFCPSHVLWYNYKWSNDLMHFSPTLLWSSPRSFIIKKNLRNWSHKTTRSFHMRFVTLPIKICHVNVAHGCEMKDMEGHYCTCNIVSTNWFYYMSSCNKLWECRCGRCERSIILNGLLDIGHYCLWEYVFKKWLNVQNVKKLFSLRRTHAHTHTMLSP